MADLQLTLLLEQLPLFKGLSHLELTELVGNTRLQFKQIGEKQTIIHENQPCQALHIITQGNCLITETAANSIYQISEQLAAPTILQPHHLFGTAPHFTLQATAITPCTILLIDKNEWMRLMEQQFAVRLNFLNLLAAELQRKERQTLLPPATTIEQQFSHFVKHRCLHPAGQKIIRIKINTLAELFHRHPRAVSAALHRLEQQQLLQLNRQRITIPQLEFLP